MLDVFTKATATVVGLMAVAVSCATPAPEAPDIAFNALEGRLLDAQVVRFAFRVTAEGAVSADIGGTLELGTGDAILLEGNGVFAGDSVDLLLKSDGGQVEFGNGAGRKTAVPPPELREAVLIGLTRMGILHNLARLMANELPDHADGGVTDWVVADSFAVDPGRDAAVSFDLFVAGRPSGSATLEISPAGLPLERHQTVNFPSGVMRVVETYSDVTVER